MSAHGKGRESQRPLDRARGCAWGWLLCFLSIQTDALWERRSAVLPQPRFIATAGVDLFFPPAEPGAGTVRARC